MTDSGVWLPKDPDNYKGEIISPVVIGTYLWVMWHTDILNIDEKTGKVCSVYNCTATELADKISQIMDVSLPANMVKKNLTLYHHQLEQMGLKFESKRTGKKRYFLFSLVPKSLRRAIFMEGKLPQYIDDTPRSETEEEDDDSMTAESVVDTSCHRPSKGPLPVSVSPFNGNCFPTSNRSCTQRIEKASEGTNLVDNDSVTDDSNAPLPT